LPAFKRAGTVFAGLALFAAATEVLQFLTEDRTARLTDMYVDLTGMVIAILLVILLRSIQYAKPGKT
jgi:VanZ family protein